MILILTNDHTSNDNSGRGEAGRPHALCAGGRRRLLVLLLLV